MLDGDSHTLVKTKLQIPQVSSELVPRPRLYEQLDEGLSTNGSNNQDKRFNKRLTLVVAPAGYGKTTLVASWLKRTECHHAWISLDEIDNNLSVLIRTIVEAIRTLFPGSCASTVQLLEEAQIAPPNYMAAVLINDIDSLQDPVILVLDDYHLIHNEAAHSLISKLIEKQPQNLHLAIASRTDPLLPLPRLRASGEVTEIRSSELRFTDAETETFLGQRMGLALDREAIAALNMQAEGWIVGLRLAVLSIRGQKDLFVLLNKLKGQSITFVNEYLVAEVLEQQPEAIRAFMLQTAILDQLSGSLCEAVTGMDDPQWNGQAYLEWMVSANLFVIPLDERGEWFRYHHLFQDLLANELRASYPAEEINVLHGRASRWFADQGYIEEGIQHAMAGDDADAAVTLVEQQSQNLLNSQDRSTLKRWLDGLPQDAVWQRPVLLIANAWLLFREWRLTALEEVLDVAESLLDSTSSPAISNSLAAHISSLRSFTAYMLWKDYEGALTLATSALEQLPKSEHGPLGIAAVIEAFSRQALGDSESAIRSLEAIVRSQSHSGPSKIQAFIGLVAIHQSTGQLQQLFQTVDQFLFLAKRRNHPNAFAPANKFAGWLNYEWNNLHEAAGRFETAIAYRYQGNFLAYFDAAIGLAKVQLAQGQMDKAISTIDDLRAEALRLNSTDVLGPVEAFQAYLWFLQDDVPSALRWARSINPDELHESILLSEMASLIQARILIWGGTDAEVTATINFLTTKLAWAQAHQFTYWAIQTQIHLALAYQRQDDRDQALTLLEQANLSAQSGGLIRSFVDMGQPVGELIAALSSRLPVESQSYLNQLMASFKTDETPQPSTPGFQSPAPTPQSPDAESITRREVEVLRLMQAGKTDQEIADGLIIALSTARRHASNIYRKLEVNNRRQAVRKAEQLGLLSPA